MISLNNVKKLLGIQPPPLKPKLVLGRKYKLHSFAGSGGMGEVWKAWDLVGGRWVALKFISAELVGVESEMKRAQDSFRITYDLVHENICPSYGLEYDSKYGLYLTMKWLDGCSLDEVFNYNRKRFGRFPWRPIPVILKPIANALDYSHRQGIIHRDVKPSNIFLVYEGAAITKEYLIDFGLASISKKNIDNGRSGTYLYMPPEQWLGKKQDGRTDLYSLAVIAYELYSGNPPFYKGSPDAIRSAAVYENPRPISGLPKEVNDVLLRGLAKKMQDRYETCGEFVDSLKRASEFIRYNPSENNEALPPKRAGGYPKTSFQEKEFDAQPIEPGDLSESSGANRRQRGESEKKLRASKSPRDKMELDAQNIKTGAQKLGIAICVGIAALALVGILLLILNRLKSL